MRQTDGAPVVPGGFRNFALCLGLLLVAGLPLPPGVAAHEEVGVVGVLAGLPQRGLTLPPRSTVTVQIEVPVKGDGDPISYRIDFTPRTVVHLKRALVRNGQLVEVELALQDDRLVVREIEEVDLPR